MPNEWVGVVVTALPRIIKGAIDATLRKRLILKMIEKAGRITTNYLGSYETDFDVDWKEPTISAFPDAAQIEYGRNDYYRQGKIDWRGYRATDQMGLKEQYMTKPGPHVMVNRYKKIIPKLIKGVRNQIGLEFYTDGYASGNENRFCGIESFCGTDGATAAGDLIANPSDTYFNLSTALNQGGSWSDDLGAGNFPNATIATDWPEGTGSTQYDYWAPFLMNTSSTAWPSGASAIAWSDTCIHVIRRALQWLGQTAGQADSGFSPVCTLSGAWMTDFKTAYEAKYRIAAPLDQDTQLGFPMTLNFEGCKIQTEYGMPATTGYITNTSTLELAILPPKLINTLGPNYDPDSGSSKFMAFTFGNFRFFPKHVAKLYPYA